MSQVSVATIKRREAQSRLNGLNRSLRNRAQAVAQQQRASLVGDGAKWRISNLQKAVRAMAAWR